jgi:Methyltransferase domain
MKTNTKAKPVIDFDAALNMLKSNGMAPADLCNLISELGSTNPAYFHNKFEGGLRLLQVPAELSQLSAYLLRRFAGKKIRYLEVGVGSCGTLIFFGHLFRKHGIDFIPSAVDDFSYTSGGLLTDQRARVQWCKENLGLNFLECDSSQGSVERWLGDNRYDLILIDADHTFEGCLVDFLTYLPHLEHTGILLFHDITICRNAVGEVYEFAKNAFSTSMDFTESNTCGIGLLEGWKDELPSSVAVARVMQSRFRAQASAFLVRRSLWQRLRQKLRRHLFTTRTE